MLEIEYKTNSDETAAATLDFMINRPILAFLFKSMQATCMMLCVVFAYAMYTKMLRPQDITAMAFAVVWLVFYKKINRWILSLGLKRRKFDTYTCNYKIDESGIFYKLHHFSPSNIQWKKLKFAIKNSQGYIIPLTGISNAGRFLWLPLRSINHAQEQILLSLLEKYKLKLVTVK